MQIGLDIMGGDFAPDAPLEGVALAYSRLSDDDVMVLYGDKDIIAEGLRKHGLPDNGRIRIRPTTGVIAMGESPTKAVMQKPESSIMAGLRDLKEGTISSFMSAGNTGAVYVGSLYTVKAIEGIMRPAITSIIPRENGGYGIILDVGANADVKPDVLYQFAILGSQYVQAVFNVENPKVGLLNIGSEPEKGNLLMQAAYTLFQSQDAVNFVGNVEGYDLFNDKADVIVCDGFTGNVVLKAAETIYQIMKKRGLTDEYFRRFDYEEYGGTPILGINKPVLIAHGISTPQAFSNMFLMAKQIIESDLADKIRQAFVIN
ncbi:MAG: phosphate acyltransferase PlsX [Bacteroidota bacterium]|nr:phosphate acyltransferase PlsX [Bacteroidota bacterium]